MEITLLLALFLIVVAGWLWWRVRARGRQEAGEDEDPFLALYQAPRDDEGDEGTPSPPEDVRPVRRKKRRRPVAALPVVLAHGMFGFDQVELRGRRYEYFRGVPSRLRREGAKVHVVKLAPTGSIETRARQLADAVDRIEGEKVNLIAHSMGGLDARYAIAKLGLSHRVASLTTIGAPHRGTPLADVGAGVLPRKVGRALRLDGVADLTTEASRRFNRAVKNVEGVAYGSVVGAVSGLVPSRMNPLLLPAFLWLRDRAGVNDGIVPSDSQAWGDVLLEVDADHWAQVGWSKGFDAPGLYAGILCELRARGF